MKHDWKTTSIIIALFLCAQLIGINILSHYIDAEASARDGEIVTNDNLYIIEPPEVENDSYALLYIIGAVLIGTVLVLILAKFRSFGLWKFWFMLSIFIGLAVAFAPYVQILLNPLGLVSLTFTITLILAGVLAYLKTFHNNAITHNFTELFIYGGIAALFVPLLTVWTAVTLLILISIYDAYAVWKSRHMIKLANFQAESKLFAGLYIPKNKEALKIVGEPKKTGKSSFAILGGGDIAFPLLFIGTIIALANSYLAGIIIAITTTLALAGLLFASQEGKFYPAMPFITVGCLIGWGISLLI